MHQLGITNVVASSGTALTEGQIGLIKRFTRNVTIMYDGDSAGIHAALRGIDMFLREDMNVRVVLIPDGDDPDSYSRKHTLSEVEDFLASSEQDFMSFKAAQLMQGTENDPIRRAEVINEIGDTIALMPDAVKRSTYINFLNDRYSIHHDALERRVSATRRKIVEDEARARRREKDGSEAAAPSSLEAAPRPAEAAYQSPERAPQGLESLEENPVMGKAERDLLNFILANGTTPLKFPSDSEFYSGEDTVQTVFDFITQALEADERTFENPAYKAAYDAYSEEYYAGYTQAQIVKHLLDSEDRTVAYVTAQLSEDERYELSVKNLRDSMMNKGSWLTSYVPKAILVYQTCRLQCLIDAQMSALRQAQESGDAQAELDAMSEMMRLRNVLKAVKVKLGREKDSN
jgi:DNA primase